MINKQTEDRDLILAYVKGNEKAFEILVMRHKNKIHRFIYMKLRDQDLTEDIFSFLSYTSGQEFFGFINGQNYSGIY